PQPEAYDRAAGLRSLERELSAKAAAAAKRPSLAAALRAPTVGVIAEVKRRSPSKGWINPAITAADQALSYEVGGAAAVSILTEPLHFGGSVDDLKSVVASAHIPA